jgi:hypothetical protein
MTDLTLLEEKRKKLFNDYNKEMKFGMIFFILAIVIVILGFSLGEEAFTIFLVVGIIIGVVGIIYFGKASRHSQSFRSLIKNELIITLLKDQFENVSYDAKGFVSISRINDTQMVRRPDRFHGEDYIRGTYKGVDFEVSDIDLKQRVETRDSKGNVTVSYQTYFKGRWYVYKFEKRFKDMLKISESRWAGMSTKGLVKVDTESMAFNKKFSIFASNQEFGFYLITSSMIEKFLELEKMHRGSILYYFANNELHIGVNDNRDYMELSIKTPINQESLKSFTADIDLIPAIINELRLDSSKFKNTL